MKKTLSTYQAKELVVWWVEYARKDIQARKLWLDVYSQHDLGQVEAEVHARLDLIATLNQRTMPKGGAS